MSRLAEALSRLDQAVVRLEAACGNAGADAGAPDRQSAPRLAESEAENRRLRIAAGDAAARVDRAVAKIDRVLAEEE
jgi:hypothetical protein